MDAGQRDQHVGGLTIIVGCGGVRACPPGDVTSMWHWHDAVGCHAPVVSRSVPDHAAALLRHDQHIRCQQNANGSMSSLDRLIA